jgi:Na+-transporting NADH:ubiquinone oxidoreductase subunit NqrB
VRTESRLQSLSDRLSEWSFIAACVVMVAMTIAEKAGQSWHWLLPVCGSCFCLSGLFLLIGLAKREEWEPTPLRIRHWLLRTPGAVLALAFVWIGVFQWTR